jgi:hypothetical protein
VLRLAKAAVRAATRDPAAVEPIREILRQARRDVQDLRRAD